MSLLLLLCVAAAAVWVALSVAGRARSGPKDSVEDFSRALSALSPQPVPARRPAARRRPARPAPRPAGRR